MRDLRVMARYLSPCRWDFFIAILLLLIIYKITDTIN